VRASPSSSAKRSVSECHDAEVWKVVAVILQYPLDPSTTVAIMAVMSERLAQEAEVLGLSGIVRLRHGRVRRLLRSGIGDFVSKPESEAALTGIEHVG